MVDREHPVLDCRRSGPVEPYLDQVSLGRADHHAFDPLLPFVRSQIGAQQLDGGAAEGEVEGPRVGNVGEKKAHHLPGADLEGPIGPLVDQQHIAHSPHEGVGGALQPVRHGALGGHLHVVEHQDFLPMSGPGLQPIRGHQDAAEESQVSQEIIPAVRVIPEQAGVGELERVVEHAPGQDRLLGYAFGPVRSVLNPDAVPVNRGGPFDRVPVAHDDPASLPDPQQRAGNLTIVRVSDIAVSPDGLPDRAGAEHQRVAVAKLDPLSAAHRGHGFGAVRAGKKRVRRRRRELHLRGHHAEPGRHRRVNPRGGTARCWRSVGRMCRVAGTPRHRDVRSEGHRPVQKLRQIGRLHAPAGREAS